MENAGIWMSFRIHEMSYFESNQICLDNLAVWREFWWEHFNVRWLCVLKHVHGVHFCRIGSFYAVFNLKYTLCRNESNRFVSHFPRHQAPKTKPKQLERMLAIPGGAPCSWQISCFSSRLGLSNTWEAMIHGWVTVFCLVDHACPKL